jgi:hypothetical protein
MPERAERRRERQEEQLRQGDKDDKLHCANALNSSLRDGDAQRLRLQKLINGNLFFGIARIIVLTTRARGSEAEHEMEGSLEE